MAKTKANTADKQRKNSVIGKPWKPGQSGNPKGRPPNVRYIPDILRKIGEEEGTTDGTMTKLEVVLRQIYKQAMTGKIQYIEFIADRTEGKALQSISFNADVKLLSSDMIDDV